MTNVINMTKHFAPDIVGPPVSGNRVIIFGRTVPNLICHDKGDNIEFILDGRIGFTIPREHAWNAAAFAANAMAIGAGFTNFEADTRPQHFAAKAVFLNPDEFNKIKFE